MRYHPHTPDDVRRALVKTLASCAAVTLRDHGGVYWVPAPFADTLRRLQIAVAGIGAGMGTVRAEVRLLAVVPRVRERGRESQFANITRVGTYHSIDVSHLNVVKASLRSIEWNIMKSTSIS